MNGYGDLGEPYSSNIVLSSGKEGAGRHLSKYLFLIGGQMHADPFQAESLVSVQEDKSFESVVPHVQGTPVLRAPARHGKTQTTAKATIPIGIVAHLCAQVDAPSDGPWS